jgi:protein-tyrosine-phosphatase/DNA-binding transcriptional ArsR family regulator
VAGKSETVTPFEFLQLIAEPVRWQLLRELAMSDRRVGELSDALGRPQNLVSYHVAQLRRAGLISPRRSSADGRDTYYRVDLDRCADLVTQVGSALHPAIDLSLNRDPSALERSRSRHASVLFLCTGNSARSQLAEALMEHRSRSTITAHSAGSQPKPVHPNAVRVLAERGIDISERTSKHLDRFARRRFTHVVTLCDRVKEVCPEFRGRPAIAHWSIPDPSSGTADPNTSYPAFVRTADEIEQRIDLLISRIAHLT